MFNDGARDRDHIKTVRVEIFRDEVEQVAGFRLREEGFNSGIDFGDELAPFQDGLFMMLEMVFEVDEADLEGAEEGGGGGEIVHLDFEHVWIERGVACGEQKLERVWLPEMLAQSSREPPCRRVPQAQLGPLYNHHTSLAFQLASQSDQEFLVICSRQPRHTLPIRIDDFVVHVSTRAHRAYQCCL